MREIGKPDGHAWTISHTLRFLRPKFPWPGDDIRSSAHTATLPSNTAVLISRISPVLARSGVAVWSLQHHAIRVWPISVPIGWNYKLSLSPTGLRVCDVEVLPGARLAPNKNGRVSALLEVVVWLEDLLQSWRQLPDDRCRCYAVLADRCEVNHSRFPEKFA